MATIAPGQSWQSAYAAAAPGEVITLLPGLHPSVQLLRIVGRSGAPVIFRGDVGVEVQSLASGRSGGSVTTPTGAELWNLEDCQVNGEVSLRWGSNNVTIKNVDAANARVTSCNDVLIEDCDLGPFVDQVVTVNSAGGAPGCNRVIFLNCYIHDYLISNDEKHAEGMQIWPTAPSSEVWVLGCRFENCTDFDILVKAPQLSGLRIEDGVFDVPMPGDVATLLCSPDCGPRWGSAIRLSTHPYPGAIIRNNVIKIPAAITVDNPTGVTVVDNIFVAELPPIGDPPPPPPPPPPPDVTPPVITLPDDILIITEDEDGIIVEFEVSAIDDVDPDPLVTSTPSSGSLFPIGTTLVRVDAEDEDGNLSTATFEVTVSLPPQPQIVTEVSVLFFEGDKWDGTQLP